MVGVNQDEVEQLAAPSAKEQLIYRYGIDAMCLLASAFLVVFFGILKKLKCHVFLIKDMYFCLDHRNTQYHPESSFDWI